MTQWLGRPCAGAAFQMASGLWSIVSGILKSLSQASMLLKVP
jgi:hypothetical protein